MQNDLISFFFFKKKSKFYIFLLIGLVLK